ncbi:MAG TPA: nicotinamide-nucleotide adenylyltransferase [Fervidicoccus fontis]|uniref:Nicotinamide-nucleotide adenylyltransferase n=1 Tax=Fervidicoccus fontis TaxID=683846 RepID=A0A7C2YH68_9CREN|nr:MAG: nicotinamide-nucleotide adenylyltransferase [Fervidicoccus sp.]HEU97577.1 nicotinamide-nucleotide adenylyltransferase [Fervidicoccus fontis]
MSEAVKALKRIVFPGRFQPVHKGHIEVIKWLLERSEEVLIVIGSAQKSHTVDNPFTAGERMLMFMESLKEEGISREKVMIVPVQDIEFNSVWVSYLESILPPFDSVASRNPLVVRLFKERGYNVLVPPTFMRGEYSGKKIRERMMNGKEWKDLVPGAVARIIDSIGGVQRLISVSLSDEEEG